MLDSGAKSFRESSNFGAHGIDEPCIYFYSLMNRKNPIETSCMFHIGTSCHLRPQTPFRALSVFLSMYMDEEAYYKRYIKLFCLDISPLVIRDFSIPFPLCVPQPEPESPRRTIEYIFFHRSISQKTSHWLNVELLNQAVQLPGDPLSLLRQRADSQPCSRLRMDTFHKIGETYTYCFEHLLEDERDFPRVEMGNW
jgi:hypothetical protein